MCICRGANKNVQDNRDKSYDEPYLHTYDYLNSKINYASYPNDGLKGGGTLSVAFTPSYFEKNVFANIVTELTLLKGK